MNFYRVFVAIVFGILAYSFVRAMEIPEASRLESVWPYIAGASSFVFSFGLVKLLDDPTDRSQTKNDSVLDESHATLRARYEGLSSEELHWILDGESYSKTAQEVAIEILREREQEWRPCSETCPCEHYFPPPTAACRRSNRDLTSAPPYRKDEDLTDPFHRN